MKCISRALLMSLVLVCAAAADEKQITGQVVDEAGKAVAGVELAIGWKCVGDNKLEPEQKLKTDRTGRFVGKVPCEDAAIALVAYDRDRKRAAMAILDAGDIGKPLKLQLAPAVEVSGELALGRFAKQPKAYKVEVTLQPKGIRVMTSQQPAAKFKMLLPAAEYHLEVSADGAEATGVDFDTRVETAKLALAPIEVEPTDANAAAPALPRLTITEARGVSKDVQLSDYKGKWVIVEVWGEWCPPCVNHGIPSMLEFAKNHKAQQDKFVILTLQSGKMDTFEKLDARLAELCRTKWNIESFPLPILLDSTRATVTALGIRSYPTAILIDPTGRIVAKENHGVAEMLAEKLKSAK